MRRLLPAALASVLIPLGAAAAQTPAPYDILLRGGTVVDGTGVTTVLAGRPARCHLITSVT